MNKKDIELSSIIDIVVECCKSVVYDDTTLTKEALLGNSKNENLCMARAILVSQLIKAGYTVNTISKLLKRTVQGIRHIIHSNYYLMKSSRAYKIASCEVSERYDNLLANY